MGAFAALTRRRLLESAPALALAALGCAGKQKLTVEAPIVTVGDALAHLRRNIKRHVGAKQRRKQALTKLDELREQLVELDRLAYAWRTSSLAAFERGDAQGMRAVAKRTNRELRATLRRMAEIGIELREHITAAEWPLVFPAPEEPRA